MIYNEIMLDLETLAAVPNAAIVSIGAVKFSWKDGIVDKFYINVDAVTCRAYKLHIHQETINWWMEQPKEARAIWQKDPVPLPDALKAFSEWFGNSEHPVWANGTNFDIPILEEAYIRTGLSKPWKYYKINDYRTILNLFNLNNKKLREQKKEKMYHSALDDAEAQAEILIEILKDFKNGTTV